jgi:predicted component of type VI protein secretion system
VIAAVDVDQALLALKIAFLVLLYLFVWFVARSATRDLRTAPQESIILSPQEAAAARAQLLGDVPVAAPAPATLVVVRSPVLGAGTVVELSSPTRIGRGAENAMRLDGDDFVSSRHAVLEPRADGLWVEDAGSTNGTFVNGARVTTPRLLQPGDVVRIGQTDLRVSA